MVEALLKAIASPDLLFSVLQHARASPITPCVRVQCSLLSNPTHHPSQRIAPSAPVNIIDPSLVHGSVRALPVQRACSCRHGVRAARAAATADETPRLIRGDHDDPDRQDDASTLLAQVDLLCHLHTLIQNAVQDACHSEHAADDLSGGQAGRRAGGQAGRWAGAGQLQGCGRSFRCHLLLLGVTAASMLPPGILCVAAIVCCIQCQCCCNGVPAPAAIAGSQPVPLPWRLLCTAHSPHTSWSKSDTTPAAAHEPRPSGWVCGKGGVKWGVKGGGWWERRSGTFAACGPHPSPPPPLPHYGESVALTPSTQL